MPVSVVGSNGGVSPDFAAMLTIVRFWVLLSTLLVGAGWVLSALHQLNRVGYGVVFALAGIVVFVWRKNLRGTPQINTTRLWHKFKRRFSRSAPKLFLLLVVLAFVSGSLLPDLNYDTDAYRLPRVFHWLWFERWHWIHTFDARMNIAGCGFEWLTAPLILFTRTDRWMFLVNWISYLMLPGLIFSVFTRLQVRPRVAWWWMWFLSAGWCFALQAGSTDNDSLAAIYILAAVDLALRAGEKKTVGDLWLSLLATALATGVKQTNLPLVLLWAIAAWPARRLIWTRPVGSFVASVVGLLVSILPISVLNYQHYGTWLPLDAVGAVGTGRFQLNPFWGVIGNVFSISLQNLMPPFHELLPPYFRYATSLWNEQMRHFLFTPFGAHFTSFENFGYLTTDYYHGICSGNAGLGLGFCLLIIATFFEMRRRRKAGFIGGPIPPDRLCWLLRLVPWGLLLLFMAKVGTSSSARHLAPYYIFLFPFFFVKAVHTGVVRQRRWQRIGLEIMVLAAIVVAGAGNRPLLPFSALWEMFHKKFPQNELVSDQYTRYVDSDFVAAAARKNFIEKSLPPDETVVGYHPIVCDSDEPGLWLPYGRRRVEYVSPGDSPERLRELGVHYVVVHLYPKEGSITNWLDKYHGTLAGQYTFPNSSATTFVPPELYLIRLN
jgi:hypothetical protein